MTPTGPAPAAAHPGVTAASGAAPGTRFAAAPDAATESVPGAGTVKAITVARRADVAAPNAMTAAGRGSLPIRAPNPPRRTGVSIHR